MPPGLEMRKERHLTAHLSSSSQLLELICSPGSRQELPGALGNRVSTFCVDWGSHHGGGYDSPAVGIRKFSRWGMRQLGV